jgi:orotidine-5'-phosphate decarboxylase
LKICVALDLPTLEENIILAKELKEYDIWLKIGLRSYIRDGKKIIESLKGINEGFHIFLDLKLYDIPNTMADAAEEIAKMGVDMFNVHASSGKRAMSEVMSRLEGYGQRPLVLAVTALTSFSEEEFVDVYGNNIDQSATKFAQDAYASNLDGVVCSVHESSMIKDSTASDFITLCPGIRPFGHSKDDQQRIATIETALDNAVDFAVVGRPIYKSTNPKEILETILEKIK